MFGTKLDNEITMLQRVVALFRDLILGVVLLITCVIVYFGGDSSKLTVLDWTKLVGAASLTVIGPVVVFCGFKLYARIMRFLLTPYLYVIYGKPVPKSMYAWLLIRLGHMSRRRYLELWRRGRAPMKKLEIMHPVLHKSFLKVVRTSNVIDRFTKQMVSIRACAVWTDFWIRRFSMGHIALYTLS